MPDFAPHDATHQDPPDDLEYKEALHHEHHQLSEADVPVVTISATFRKKLEAELGEDFPDVPEVAFSRAHYSMALGVMMAAMEAGKSSWMSDPTNYVTSDQWGSIVFTEYVAKLMARHKPLKKLKDLIDTKVRNKLPITDAIDDPLLYLTEHIEKPIISMHYEAGNILAAQGKQVVQVVTDPHVRPQYLTPLPDIGEESHAENLVYCVFDEATKTDLLLRAQAMKKMVRMDQVVVTGPPIDPRIVAARKKKRPDVVDRRPLRLAVTTSGVGTNKREIRDILDQLASYCYMDKQKGCVQLFLYAGTHKDFEALYQDFVREAGLKLGSLDDDTAHVRILYADNLAEANELLIQYMFPWADGVITKPSGDMAYDAAAAGCFCLFLEPWGPWEANIQERFLDLGIGLDLDVEHFAAEMARYEQHFWEGESWFRHALETVQDLPELYLNGAAEIVKVQQGYFS